MEITLIIIGIIGLWIAGILFIIDEHLKYINNNLSNISLQLQKTLENIRQTIEAGTRKP